LIPLEAMLMAGRYYAGVQTLNVDALLDLAIQRLGLDQMEPFDKGRKIIEFNL
jgi:hypothetical protein